MSEFEHNIPDDFWRKAFEDAAETPPPRVWDAVERRLDEGDGPKILPLWGSGLASSRSFVWGSRVAAAVALLLVGWWLWHPEPGRQPIAQTQLTKPAGQVAMNSRTAGRQPTIDVKGIAKQHHSVASVHRQSTTAKPASPSKAVNAPDDGLFAQTSPNANLRSGFGEGLQPASASDGLPNPKGRSSTGRVASVAFASAISDSPTAQLPEPQQALSFDALATLPVRLRELRPIDRIVWVKPYDPADSELNPVRPEETRSNRASREVWASVSMMPGAFNPSVSVRTPSVASAYALVSSAGNSPANTASVSSRADFSVAYQAGAGVQLTERWSVESGVGYLMGRSTVDSPAQSVYAIQTASADPLISSNNLYADAMRNSLGANLAKVSFDNLNGNTVRYVAPTNYNAQTRQTIRNDYQYVQVPMQIGYQLRPRKRLGLALLGGLLTNIFVRNTVGNDLVVTAKDGVYRPLSWAATMGARLRFRPSHRWSASLAGVYQPALSTGTLPASQVQNRPSSTGMSFGVDYHF